MHFPTYKFEGKVKDNINKFHKKCGISRVLPGLPNEVGGETDILIGIKYLKYFPREVMYLPSGLTVSIFQPRWKSRSYWWASSCVYCN